MNKRPIVIAGAVLVLVAAFAIKESKKGVARVDSAQGDTPQTMTLPRLVDLGANKCIPCKKMAPILEELSRTYQDVFEVEFIDVWKNPGAGKEWGIRVIPTQVFLDAAGTERFRHQGFMGREAILAKWTELGVELPSRSSSAGS